MLGAWTQAEASAQTKATKNFAFAYLPPLPFLLEKPQDQTLSLNRK